MHTYVRTLTKIASRYAPSRTLSFDSTHVIKVLQLLEKEGHVSRNLLCQELSLGEGSSKTSKNARFDRSYKLWYHDD